MRRGALEALLSPELDHCYRRPTQDPPIPELEVDGYKLEKLLGEGGMGAVYLATDASSARVVLKLIHPSFVGHSSAAARFAREAAVTSALDHPAIVRVLASDIDTAQPFIAMEYVEGRTLSALIREEAPLGVARACALTQQVLAALAHAHAHGIVHRDLKPANVMLTLDADGAETVKVLDFGIAALFDGERHARLTRTGQILGTPGYLAPEQAEGQHVDGRADLWAAGVLLYAMLTRQLPFPGEVATDRIVALLTEEPIPVTAYRPDLPPALVAALGRLLTKEPAGRYPTAVEAALAIAAAVPRDWVDVPAPAGAATAPAAVDERPSHPSPRHIASSVEPTTTASSWAEPSARSAAAPGPEVPTAPGGPADARPGRIWERPWVLAALLLTCLVVVGAGTFALAPRLFGPPAPTNPSGAEGPAVAPEAAELGRQQPQTVVPVAPVAAAVAVALADRESRADADTREGATGPGASRADTTTDAPTERRTPSRGRSERRAAATETAAEGDSAPEDAPERREPSATPEARPGDGDGVSVCENGAHMDTYTAARSSHAGGYARAYDGMRPAFYIAEDGGCLRGVRTGVFSIELNVDSARVATRVDFIRPGPLTRRMQSCLRRRMLESVNWNPLQGPDVITLHNIRLVCF